MSATSPDSPEKAYRPDIDGLRAVAVLGVLFFHLNGNSLPGGFVGVDVFFVISGYLITAIITREMALGEFSILRFYERRIRRICPALFAMLAVVVAAAFIILVPDDLLMLAKSVRYTVLSASNFLFLRNSENYFGQGSDEIPLLHTWSLAVEEQFYLVFPLLMLLLHRFCKTRGMIAWSLAVLFLASLAASALVVDRSAMSGFFLLPYRAWELLLGAGLAITVMPAMTRAWNHALGLAGIVMILAAMAAFDENTPFPGLAALLPCVGGAFVIWAGRDPQSWGHRLLALKPLVGVGLISYSLYLWHWPWIVFAKYLTGFDAGTAAGVFAASLLSGFLSWRFIERPFRGTAGGFPRKRVFQAWAAISLIFLSAGTVINRGRGYPDRFSAGVIAMLDIKKPAKSPESFDLGKAVVFGAPGVRPEIAIWGDSHAQALLPLLDSLGKKTGRAVRYLGLDGVPPVVGVTPRKRPHGEKIADYSARTMKLLMEDPGIRTVILHARWSVFEDRKLGGYHENPSADHEEMKRYFALRIRRTVAELLSAHKQVVLVYPVTEIGCDLPMVMARNLAAGKETPATIPGLKPDERQVFLAKTYDSLGDHEALIRIHPADRLVENGRIRCIVAGRPLYRDDNHLSPGGALYLEELFQGIFTDDALVR